MAPPVSEAMEDHVKNVIQITPNPESLVITYHKNHGIYKCTESYCSFTTSSPSLFGLHKAQAHNITRGTKKGVVHQYFCPGSGCYYTPQSGRFFKTFDVLKTHYMKVHTEKKFECSKCKKAFGLERDCLRHEKDCGQIFTCPDCGKSYDTKNALNMHCVSKRHKKPPELCSKPKIPPAPKPSPVPEKPKPERVYPIPILPKPDSVDVLLPPSKGTRGKTDNYITSSDSPVKIVVRNVPPPSQTITKSLITTPSQPAICDNIAQTAKSLLSLSSQTKVKCHTPTQTKLSILERAMKSSKIPVTKASKGTQKSYSKLKRHRKRKSSDCGTSPNSKALSRMNIATLTDFNFSPFNSTYNFTKNSTESQTLFSIFENQITKLPPHTVESETQCKISASTQTRIKEYLHGNRLQKEHFTDVGNFTRPLPTSSETIALQCNGPHPDMVTDSNTQTVNSFVPQNTRVHLNNSETQTSLRPFSNSITQTQEIQAFDSGTQTLRSDPNFQGTSDFIDQLLSDNEMNDVNTQTFGSFLSDMMTQTLSLDQLTSSIDGLTDSDNINNNLYTINTTTQTLDEMVDNITQTFTSGLTDCMTQTSLRNDTMTQTAENLGVDSMTQTSTPAHFNHITLSHQHFNTNSMVEIDESVSQITLENGRSVRTQTMPEIFSTDVDALTQNFNNIVTDIPTNYVPIHSVMVSNMITTIPSSQTSSILTSTSASENNLSNITTHTMLNSAIQAADSLVVDSMTQTLQLPNDDLNLERLLSDMATQTFENDKVSFDAFFHSSEDLSSNHITHISTSPNVSDFACQTLVPVDSKGSEIDIQLLTPNMPLSTEHRNTRMFRFDTQTQNNSDSGDIWEMGTQTGGDAMATQTVGDDLWAIAAQTDGDNMEIQTRGDSMGTQTLDDDLWEMATQTGGDNMGTQTMGGDFWEMATRTGGDNMGTQTLGDDLWEMATQAGGDNMGTQTLGDDLWEMATQTGGDNMGTQTMGDDLWEMATQTGEENLWEIATQTGGDNMGTQTGGDDLWEIATQTGGDSNWEIGTQTGGDDLWEMATQTGGDSNWEIGTQTGGDDLWEMATQTGTNNNWETGTQTMESLLTDMTTQTADNLIDFLIGNQDLPDTTGTQRRMNQTKTNSFMENIQTQTTSSSPICFSGLDLF